MKFYSNKTAYLLVTLFLGCLTNSSQAMDISTNMRCMGAVALESTKVFLYKKIYDFSTDQTSPATGILSRFNPAQIITSQCSSSVLNTVSEIAEKRLIGPETPSRSEAIQKIKQCLKTSATIHNLAYYINWASELCGHQLNYTDQITIAFALNSSWHLVQPYVTKRSAPFLNKIRELRSCFHE
ncbi:MAG: hypothetical protein UU47_C0010G0001 [candidate division TM6 bacterium GW2011_GWE2_41_16]|nr:MAG: hypothetical protein UU47_C0010G0001 [candidate division TM6 bacterium GW2011_GWE2_41_16]